MEEENNNPKGLIWAIILSVAIVIISGYLFPATQPETPLTAPESIQSAPLAAHEQTPAQPLDSTQALAKTPRVKLSNSSISGSISLKGARFDDILLDKYKQTLSSDSPDVELLSPSQTAHPYYAEFGWLSNDPKLKLPNSNTIWNLKGSELTPESPITLEWDNGQGLRFVRIISVDDNYMFKISDNVENNSGRNITLYPYGMIARTPDLSNSSASVVHEGISGVMDDTLHEVKYKDLDQGESQDFTTTGGWTGFSDRYWFSAFILNNSQTGNIKVRNLDGNTYQVDYLGQAATIPAGGIGSNDLRFFAGAKEIKLLDRYAKKLGIPKFDLAVDFGWYYFLTKPFFYILDFLYNLIGNMGWAILLFAALLRLAMYPIAGKSYESMSKMKKLQPKLQTLQERYGDDKMKLQQETMELYRKEKINPAAGCLPLLIQIPVFFSLYKVLNIAIEIRHAPFIGWIKDLSAPDPLTLSVITHLPIPGLLDIGVWPIIMGITMYIQQKLNPAPTNKDQARMFALLPLIFMFMLGHFASGLVIYWTLSNILSIIQQKAIMRKHGV